MSVLAAQPTILSFQLPGPRKRTSSFSYPNQSSSAFAPSPRPLKAPRLAAKMGGTLRRTESYIDIRSASMTQRTAGSDQPKSLVPHNRTLKYYKEQRDRERRRAQINRSVEPVTIRIRADPAPLPITHRNHVPQPSKSSTVPASPQLPHVASPGPRCAVPTVRTPPRQTSPLAPSRGTLPGRPLFPRSKPEPDLYRLALKTSMKASPEGQKILRMGPRLAISIMTATKELERLVAAQESEPQDVVMADATTSSPVLTKSWVVVSGEDWEMVECAA
ncbi:hypothetical protein LshimejAT787_1802330 [Lyophyllum shimeji]|uniref:Uncharacterized protein n=1 Tax=Lyophyllum shimeji TaxID=47721 RepID=A0A9P3Q1B9_LYOSH|nr:hypothetical protein LshimejAT787_1802330 [Lyophyllum shimeji]